MAHSPRIGFDEFYSGIYGPRWEALRAALLDASHPVALPGGLASPYYMDRASIIAAQALPVSPGDRVLDMCAAPGGKTLVLALKLAGAGLLVANDRSSERRSRLRQTLESCLPSPFREIINVTAHDSSKWGLHEEDAYDAILLDAPCSSERHVMASPEALKVWSPSRPKRLAIQQFAMLAAALKAARPGGWILYSTCSICPMENEQVVEKLMARHPQEAAEVVPENPGAELARRLSYGQIIMPDASPGLGPLYFCLLRKAR